MILLLPCFQLPKTDAAPKISPENIVRIVVDAPMSLCLFTVASPFEIRFYDDINEDFLMEGVIGAEGSVPKSFRIYVTKNDLRSFVAQALRKNADLEVLTNEFFSCYLKREF